MAGITLEQADAKLALWLAADDAVSKGQSHTIGNRSFTDVDADEIRRNIDYWDKKCRELANAGGTAGGPTISQGIP